MSAAATVLLKNDGVLPLKAGGKVALTLDLATTPTHPNPKPDAKRNTSTNPTDLTWPKPKPEAS